MVIVSYYDYYIMWWNSEYMHDKNKLNIDEYIIIIRKQLFLSIIAKYNFF